MSDVKNFTTFHDYQYLDLMSNVRNYGRLKTDRTGTGTTSVFGREMRFDIRHGVIPVLTTKKMHWPSLIHEIIWYLSGTGNIKYLQENGVRIWNEWADENGDLGPVYGYQWRNWPTVEYEEWDNPADEPLFYIKEGSIDQIAEVINTLKTNPDSRRIMVNAWNVGQLAEMKLPPCHYTFQFYTEEMTQEERIEWFRKENPDLTHDDLMEIFGYSADASEPLEVRSVPTRYLSCKITQRSADVFLGVPFNIAQYSILTTMIAQVVGMAAHELIWSGGDVHIYSNHMDQVNEQLTRMPTASPVLVLNKSVDNIDNFKYSDFSLKDYQSHPAIKAKVAV
jgi:thymidylate synthase